VLLATRFPRPDVRDLVRRLPARVAFTPDVGCSTEASQSRRLEPLSADRYGEGTIENLRLRCRAHNRRYARQYFGASRVEAAIRRSRRREEALREA